MKVLIWLVQVQVILQGPFYSVWNNSTGKNLLRILIKVRKMGIFTWLEPGLKKRYGDVGILAKNVPSGHIFSLE